MYHRPNAVVNKKIDGVFTRNQDDARNALGSDGAAVSTATGPPALSGAAINHLVYRPWALHILHCCGFSPPGPSFFLRNPKTIPDTTRLCGTFQSKLSPVM